MKFLVVYFLAFICSLSTGVAQSFSGNYTVDASSPQSSTNYQSLAVLADSISLHGVSGPVFINVVGGSGPYNEQVWFKNIPGMDAFNPIVLNGNGETFTAVTTTTDRHVIRIEGVSHFTISGFNIDYNSSSTGGFYGIHIYRSADSITVEGNTINMNSNSTLHGGIVCSGSETSILDDGDFHNILIENNTTTSGGYGASLFGEAANLSTGVVIRNNTFYDWHSNGVYLRETNGVLVDHNRLNKRDAAIGTANAIQLAQAMNFNGTISNNHISVAQSNNGTMTLRGIYVFNGTGHRVYNNLIDSVQLTSGNFIGIEVRTGATSPAISFNTIILDNASSSTGNLIGIGEELSNTNSVLRNNLISIAQTTSGLKAALVLAANSLPASALNSNYNVLYAPGGAVCYKNAITPTTYSTLANWQAAGGMDLNSWSVDPQTLNSIPTNASLDNKGISIANISTDITGVPRPFTPDIGAYEFLTTGLNSATVNSFEAYPNPANEYYFIKTDLKKFTSRFYNARGEELNIHPDISGNQLKLDTRLLPDGMYLLELESGGQRWVQKLIVKH